MPVAAAVLPALPPETDPLYLAVRAQRAELAAVKAIEERDVERDARIGNAITQQICASWARQQP